LSQASKCNPSSGELDEVALAIDEIVSSRQQGQHHSIDYWVQKFPLIEADLRELIPILMVVEGIEHLPPSAAYNENRIQSTGISLPRDLLEENTEIEEGSLLGDFKLHQRIGRGGMGVVYAATQVSLRRPVAIKILARHLAQDINFVARFQREARSAARLLHPNIAQVYGIGYENGIWFYSMPLIEGQSFEAILRELRLRHYEQRIVGKFSTTTTTTTISPAEKANSTGSWLLNRLFKTGLAEETQPMPDSRVALANADTASIHDETVANLSGIHGQVSSARYPLNWKQYYQSIAALMRDTAYAIDYAHGMGTIHRDVKPSNLLMDRAGKVWVTDFGLAKIDTDTKITQAGDLLGTLRYCAPEQLEGVSAPSCDIYGLGATLYELLTFQPAIVASEKVQVIAAIREKEPIAPRLLDPEIPLDLQTIALKAIAKDPRSRYASAAAMADDLTRYLDGRPISARPASSIDHLLRWSRRNRTTASLVVLIVIGILSVSLASFWAAISFLELANSETESRKSSEVALTKALKAEASLLRQLYASDIDSGIQAAKAPAGLHKVREIVSRWSENAKADDIKGWEFNLLKKLSQQELIEIKHGCNSDQSISASPHGRWICLADGDGLCIYDSQNLREQRRLKCLTHHANLVEYSPDGNRIACTTFNQELVVIDVGEDKIVASTPFTGVLRSILWKKDCEQLVLFSTVDSTAELATWKIGDAELKKVTTTKLSAEIGNFDIDDQQNRVAGVINTPDQVTPRMLCVWDGSTWQEIHRHPFAAPLSYLKWSRDGALLAVASWDGKVEILDADTWATVATLDLARPVRGLDWNTDSSSLAIACDDLAVRIWDRARGKVSDRMLQHQESPRTVKFANKNIVVTVDESYSTRLWDLTNGMAEMEFRLGDQLDATQVDVSVRFSPDDSMLAAGAAFPASIWRTADGQHLHTITGSFVNWSSDGNYIATRYRDPITIWNGRDFQEVTANEKLGLGLIRVFSPTGNDLAGTDPETFWIWDIDSKTVRRSPEKISSNNPDHFQWLSWSPDGKMLAVAVDSGKIHLCNTETLRLIKTIQPFNARIHCVEWSPDGQSLAVSAANPCVKIIDWQSEEVLYELNAHTLEVWSLSWSRDQRRLATGGADRKLFIWNTRTMTAVAELEFDNEIRSVAWSHNGKMLAAVSQDGLVKLWRTQENSVVPARNP
jgi:eukaryotic-like serine/threonine-protein kinase